MGDLREEVAQIVARWSFGQGVSANDVADAIIPIVLKRAAEIARSPGFIQAQDSEWDSGVEYAKRFIAEAIERAAQP